MDIMFPFIMVYGGKRGHLQQKIEKNLLWDSQELAFHGVTLRNRERELRKIGGELMDITSQIKRWGDAVHGPS